MFDRNTGKKTLLISSSRNQIFLKKCKSFRISEPSLIVLKTFLVPETLKHVFEVGESCK